MLIALLVLVLSVPPTVATTREAMAGAEIIADLLGTWDGEGELFGQPAEFAMSWDRVLDGRFLKLDYAIRGATTMEATAHYRLGDGSAMEGVWVDSRGEILELRTTVSESNLETIWKSPSEQGRTTYELADPQTLVVEDFYYDGEGWQLFGRARYAKAARP